MCNVCAGVCVDELGQDPRRLSVVSEVSGRLGSLPTEFPRNTLFQLSENNGNTDPRLTCPRPHAVTAEACAESGNPKSQQPAEMA